MKTSKRNIRYQIDSHHHGLFVKEARLRQGYRLTEVANEICDTSYLSKIESGRIVPTPEIFEKIADKLKIQFPSETRMCPIELFRTSLYQEDMSIIESYLTNHRFHHYEIQMIHFFQAVIHDELSKAFTLKKMIDGFRHHFNKKEEQVYMLFSGIYSFKSFQWEQGHQCFEKSLELAAQMKEEDPYLYFNFSKHCFQMGKTWLGFFYLERATTAFEKIFEKEWVFKCGILWCRESVKNDNIQSAEIKLEMLRKIINPHQDHLQWRDFFNILGMICEKRGQDVQAEAYYIKSIEQEGGNINEDFIIDTIKFHYGRQNHDQLLKLIERLDLSRLSERARMIIDFYYFKVSDETSEHFEVFLRKDAIPFAIKGLDVQSVALYTKELNNYHRNKLSYKKVADAYYKWEKFCDELKLI